MTNYTRPEGVIGGSCLHCQGTQPEHVGLTCDQVRENRKASIPKMLARASPKTADEAPLEQLILDCIFKGYEVTFKSWQPGTDVNCCVEYPGQYPGAKPFTHGQNLREALIAAARYAKVDQA